VGNLVICLVDEFRDYSPDYPSRSAHDLPVFVIINSHRV
jgi:hypothetical protein